MKNYQKYKRGYFNPPKSEYNWTKKEYITVPPIWCSVDLRDGNQALAVPMSLPQKLQYFDMLVKLGFKDIEVGFPAASDTEYNFLRTLIENNLIPDDVRIQVLTQSREHIIKRTFEALAGSKNAIVHLYNSTSISQREQVFRKSKEEIIELAVTGARLIKEQAERTEGNFTFEYSPESFTGTEMEFARDICNAVLEVWQPTKEHKAIINLPVTVELSLPHIYANQVEYIVDNIKFRDDVIVSIHPHNDRGSAVAAAELGLLAGADRVEGTLFGNGERTGNVDLITLALNMYSHGVDPKLNLDNIPEIIKTYENTTGLSVYERQPYSGDLVFAAFSGSHQDAIAKAINYRKENRLKYWNVPYLPLDPKDIGREYESNVIRINSQSGKGGVGYILKNRFNIDVPKELLYEFGQKIKSISDNTQKEITPKEIYDIFTKEYVNYQNRLKLIDYHFTRDDKFNVTLTVQRDGAVERIEASGNGRLNAVNNAIKQYLKMDYTLANYKEYALESGSTSKAIAYVKLSYKNRENVWGAGTDEDIVTASIQGLFSAVNKLIDI